MSKEIEVPTQANESRTSASPRFARSRQMVNCLRQELLYSEKRARDMLFTAIATLLADRRDGAIMVAQVTREASWLAQLEGARVGYQFVNWNNAGKAVMKALLCSASLLGPDGGLIPFGVTAQAAAVAALCNDYRDRAEAFLIELLVRRLGDVTLRDHTALAHALFRQFDPRISMYDLEDRVAILVARLDDRVTLNGDLYVAR